MHQVVDVHSFVTPSESRLREKSFSRNAEQVRSPLILLFLGGCRGIRTYVFDYRAGVVRCVHMGVVQIRAYEFTDTGNLLFLLQDY